MTTNKPEVEIYEPSEKGVTAMRKASFRNTGLNRYVLLSDYEALQAELARELQRRFDGNEQASREHRADVLGLVEALGDALTSLEEYAVMVDGEWGLFRDLGQLEEDDALPQCVKDARAALAAYRKGGDAP